MAAHKERTHQQNRQAKCPIIGCSARTRKHGLINHIVDKHPAELRAMKETFAQPAPPQI